MLLLDTDILIDLLRQYQPAVDWLDSIGDEEIIVPMWATLPPPWQACVEEAWAAYCAGSVPVGAVVTDATGKILARGRNHARDGGPAPVHSHTLAHAEVNALLALASDHTDPHTCVLYTSCEPCPLCLGAFYMSGLRELRYA